MATRASSWLGDAGLAASLLADDTTDTLPASAYAHPVLFKLSALAHEDVPKYYFQEFAASAGFAAIKP
jgi:hypothetical protein